jgi:hypothetical protein
LQSDTSLSITSGWELGGMTGLGCGVNPES